MAQAPKRNRKALVKRQLDSRQPIVIFSGSGGGAPNHVYVQFDRPVQLVPGSTNHFAVTTAANVAPSTKTATALPDGLTFEFDYGSALPADLLIWPYLPKDKWVPQLNSYIDSLPFRANFE